MITGLGIDLIDIDRIKKAADHNPKFPSRILTPQELALFDSYGTKRQMEFLAGRFAAKEAYAKALGTGIGQTAFLDIEILPDDQGRPTIQPRKPGEFALISITHTDDIAMAEVIIQDLSDS